MLVDVKEIMELEVKRDFILEQGPSTTSAALRLAQTEKMLHKWYNEVNDTDTKNLPAQLLRDYQKAFETIVSICGQEKKIVLGEK